MTQLYNFCWLILAQTQVGGAAGTAPAAAEPTKAPGIFDGFMLPAMLGIMLLYFFMMARPQPKGKTATTELLATLKKNDRVVTAGGILGTVVNVKSDSEYVTLRIDDSSNARMQVLASSVVRVVSDEDEKEKK